MIHSTRLNSKTLGWAVEKIYQYRRARNWSDEYASRLLHAFHIFDQATGAGKQTFNELKQSDFVALLKSAKLSYATLRDLRLILNVVFANLQALGGYRRYDFLEREMNIDAHFERDEFVANLKKEDFDQLFKVLSSGKFDWRAGCAIELGIRLDAPMATILRMKWSQFKDNRWYHGRSRKWIYGIVFDNLVIHDLELQCIIRAFKSATDEGIQSDFVFPSVNPKTHIKNIDRRWKAALKTVGWQQCSLLHCSMMCLQSRFYMDSEQINSVSREEIAAELSKMSTPQ